MSITVKYLENLGIEKETAEKIFAERSEEIARDKAKYEELENKLNDKQKSLDDLTAEFEKLKETNVSAEDYKAKFEALQNENAEKEKKAEADRVAKEKADRIASRFTAVVGDKKFSHEAVKNDYLRKFGEALENKEYEGKSDADIFHDLTKDDGAAFSGVSAVRLAGGTNKTLDEVDTDSARAIMGLPPLK